MNGQTHVLLLTPVQPPPAPLVFIPGIAGSVLKADPSGTRLTSQVWPTIYPLDIADMNVHSGLTIQATEILKKTDGLLGAAVPTVVYQTFFDHLQNQGFQEFQINGDRSRMTTNFPTSFDTKPTLFPFPYDWRLSNASHTATLHQYIQNIRQLNGGAKVNLVAHSMGGLIVRRYILEYGDADIDHVVTVGSPLWGAPVSIYRMLAGEFFPIEKVNWVNNSVVTATLPTFPAFHELLPSDSYLANGGSPVMAEDHFDYNLDGIATGSYTSSQFKALIDAVSSPETPSRNNSLFHNYLLGREDDWSADNNGISYLHVCGQQATDKTPVAVTVHSETRFAWTGYPLQVTKFVPTWGAGDGVVPLLSSRRLDRFLAPRTQTRVIQGSLPGVVLNQYDGAEHVALMQNETVFSMIDSFLRGDAVPPSPAVASRLALAGATTAASTRRIAITGCGYVGLVDGAGNANTKLSDLAVKQIPGVSVQYGGSQPWVDITVNGDVDLNIQGTSSDQAIEVAVQQVGTDGTPISFRRYQFKPSAHAWRTHLPPANTSTASDLAVAVDANDNGTYEAAEQVAPSHSSGSGPVDTTAPFLDTTLSTAAGGQVVVNLAARDDGPSAPAIRYTLNDGPVQTYTAPLTFAPGANTVLKAFAEDGMGNTSGLITTTVRPTLSAQGSVGGVSLQWPVADAYILEETDNLLGGAWTRSAATVTRNGFTESATVPTGTAPRKFFRLRAQTVTR